MRIDIDAARAARLEAEGEPHELVFHGQSYTVPAEAHWKFVHYLNRGQIPSALAAGLGEDTWSAISEHATREDLRVVLDNLMDVWGIGNEGEANASGSSSPDGGSSSRPTSSGTTAST